MIQSCGFNVAKKKKRVAFGHPQVCAMLQQLVE